MVCRQVCFCVTPVQLWEVAAHKGDIQNEIPVSEASRKDKPFVQKPTPHFLDKASVFLSALFDKNFVLSVEPAYKRGWKQVWKLYLSKVMIWTGFQTALGRDWSSPQRFGQIKSNLLQRQSNSRQKNFTTNNAERIISVDIPVDSRPERIYWYTVKSERFSSPSRKSQSHSYCHQMDMKN